MGLQPASRCGPEIRSQEDRVHSQRLGREVLGIRRAERIRGTTPGGIRRHGSSDHHQGLGYGRINRGDGPSLYRLRTSHWPVREYFLSGNHTIEALGAGGRAYVEAYSGTGFSGFKKLAGPTDSDGNSAAIS